MPDSFLLRLPATAQGTYETAELDLAGTVSACAAVAPDELPERAAGRRCLAIVPGVAVVVTRVHLPTRRYARIRQALPYALEEQLTSDLEELHFAIQRVDSDGGVQAAAVAHADLQAWLQELSALGLEPDALVPENGILPLAPGHWEVIADEAHALLSLGGEGISLEADAAPVTLEAALAAAQARPEALGLSAPEGLATQLQAIAASHEVVTIDHETGERPLLERLANRLDPRRPFNLLQGPYERGDCWGWLWRPLRPAAALLGVWLLAQLTLQVVELQRLEAEHGRLNEEIESVYRETFPEGRIVNPRAQMENHLRNLQGDNGAASPDGALSTLLGGAAPALATDGVELRALRLRDGALTVELEAGDIESIEQLRATIEASEELAVEIRSASAQGERVDGRLVIREAQA